MKVIKIIGASCMFAFLTIAAIASQNFAAATQPCDPQQTLEQQCPGKGIPCCITANGTPVSRG